MSIEASEPRFVDLRDLLIEFQEDENSLTRLFPVEASTLRRERFSRFYADWLARLEKIDFSTLAPAGKVDYVLLENHLDRLKRTLNLSIDRFQKIKQIVPFADPILRLDEARILMTPIDPLTTAEAVDAIAKQIQKTRSNPNPEPREYAWAAWKLSTQLEKVLEKWFKFYDGYDPAFSWWVREPYQTASEALADFSKFLEKDVLGLGSSDSKIVGQVAGRDALLADLEYEMIPYSPEELLDLGERECAWCQSELVKAAQELGFGDDVKAAREHVKNSYVAPGDQTKVVRQLALEAIDYLEAGDLLTIPDLAKETWRMTMMTPEAQLTNPFFLGGECIWVSYPTDSMSHEKKMMSARGNNPHFSRATVQHELIPGHHMQQFFCSRYRPERGMFSTPFWIEGWTLHWEMLLWDLGFASKPEDRIGMLFWRMHRCVRIVFSIRYHLGQLTPEECVDMLVDRVGHERANAEGEVRRSLNGEYPPLYQAAYMIGGLQVRSMHRELVGSGKMTNREFHDAFLRENEMPIAILRQILSGSEVSKEEASKWRFLEVLGK